MLHNSNVQSRCKLAIERSAMEGWYSSRLLYEYNIFSHFFIWQWKQCAAEGLVPWTYMAHATSLINSTSPCHGLRAARVMEHNESLLCWKCDSAVQEGCKFREVVVVKVVKLGNAVRTIVLWMRENCVCCAMLFLISGTMLFTFVVCNGELIRCCL